MSTRRLGLIKRPSAGGFDFQNAFFLGGGTPERNGDAIFDNVIVNTGGDFTYNVWIRFKNFISYRRWLSGDASGGLDNSFMQWGAVNTIIRTKLGSSTSMDFTITPVVIDDWNMISLVFRSGLAYLYLNNVKSAESFIPVGFRASGFNNILDSRFVASCDVDEMGIKNGYGATDTDISNLWNGGNGVDFASIISSPDIHYKYDQSTGLIVNDSSINGNNATIANFDNNDLHWVAH